VFFWKYRLLRWAVPGVTVAVGVFLMLPGRSASQEALREKYVGCLKRYEGVHYVWGGENAIGIDCSGLIRRGLMDALFLEGVRSFNPGLVRESIKLWWNDTTARVLGEGAGSTVAVMAAPQINVLDHTKLRAGDLAVTTSGIHVLAYLGDQTWIEADPGAERVILAKAPSQDNPWLSSPVNIVRWKLLQP
jgi:cell wall-associated NlpC family hydrolase